LLHTFVRVYFLEMDDRYFQTIDDPDLHIHDDPDLYVNDDPDFHIVDGVETIYEEDLESFENKSSSLSSSNALKILLSLLLSDNNKLLSLSPSAFPLPLHYSKSLKRGSKNVVISEISDGTDHNSSNDKNIAARTFCSIPVVFAD
ncbi:20214_t:CDS:2, partial [Gigaspora rosea]